MAGGSQKYEREIAEILERMERDEPRAERVKRQARASLWQRQQKVRGRFSSWRGIDRQYGRAAGWTWIGVTIAVGIVGLLLRGLVPVLAIACGIIMVVLFFAPLLGRIGRAPEPSPSNLWRGKVVDLQPRGGLFASLRYRWWRFRSEHKRRTRL